MTDLPPPSHEGTTSTGTVPDKGARGSRHATLPVVSVAIAVLLAGGGSAYWVSTATSDDRDTTGAEADPPPLPLDGFAAPRHGERDVADPSAVESARAPYHAVNALPDDAPQRAPVYHATGSPTQDTIATLAKALRLPDTPERTRGGWQSGDTAKGGGAILQVAAQAPATWVYTRQGQLGKPVDGHRDGPVPPLGDTSVSSPHTEGAGAPSAPSTSRGDQPVSPRQAERAVAPLLRALGLEDAERDTGLTVGATRVVTIDPRYDGLPTQGWQTQLQVDSQGALVGGSGPLVTPRQGASYPVLSARETLKELNRMADWGQTRCHLAQSARPERPASAPEPRGDQPAATRAKDGTVSERGATDRCARSTPHQPTRVTGAVLGLAKHSVRGQPVLVPSWLFHVKSGTGPGHHSSTVPYPAVAPRYLDQRRDASPGGGDDGRGSPPAPGSHSPTRPDTSVTEVERYDPEDRTLTVRFWGGQCTDYTGAAQESADTVRVRVTARPLDPEVNCVAIAKKLSVEVSLEKPVGSREVVDRRGAPLPKT